MTRLRRPWSDGQPRACPTIRAPSWCLPGASRRSITFVKTVASPRGDDAAEHTEALADDAPAWDEQQANGLLEDDRLRLVFTCCHPSLAAGTQVALTLREVCGLTTEEIAKAFCCPHLRWRSALCGLSPKFAMPGFRTKYPTRQNLQSDSAVRYG